jgi:hypothetical protein
MWGILTLENQRPNLPQSMAYRVAKEVLSLIISFLIFHPLFSLSPGVRRTTERQWLVMPEGIRVCKGSHLSLGPRNVIAKVARRRTFAKCSKGCVYVYTPPLFAYHDFNNARYGNRIQNGPHDCRRQNLT